MSTFSRLYRAETEYDFVGGRKRWFAVSLALVSLSLLGFLIRGLNLNVDFEGGVTVQVDNKTNSSVADMREALSGIGLSDARIEFLESLDGSSAFRVRTQALDPSVESRLVLTVAETAGVGIDETDVDAVGPTFGEEITRRAVEALLVFLVVVALFISWRFEWKMAMAGLTALFHDLVITFGVYALVGFEVTPATVVAVLTILGYSLYDTVVVFDKVNENVESWSDKHTYTEVVNKAMNQVLMRSINTSMTSLLPVGSLLFIGSYLLGASTLREFALALFVGIAAGTYSSIFVASPLLAVWKEKEEYWHNHRRRLEGRRDARIAKTSATPAVAPQASRPPSSGGATPRPPKKKRRKR
ncbi:MAG TPA: protein translocase subunit SecF [Acidimicrobiia bacterium]|nr:protein translocase subunit SecF [Acidimicrobiia bacterium]